MGDRGRSATVTGASRGVGDAAAGRLGRGDGVVVDRRSEHADERVRVVGGGDRPRVEPAGVAR